MRRNKINREIGSLPEEVRWVWNARWSSYWFGDKEFSDFTEKDFDKKAFELKQSGINAVITFGDFHFRWNFTSDWPKLLSMLKNICDSCHKYGVKVVEHHSANHIRAPLGEEEWKSVLNKRSNFDIRNHSEVLRQIQDGDLIYKGVRLSSMFQIDPRTGQFSRSNYQGWVICHNNPDYQKHYFNYLEEIYNCGVDGIMTDDIGFYPAEYGCGCIYCRAKFKKDTGYEMPPTGIDDRIFYGNLENPVYRSWLLWRMDCYREHEERLVRHFQGLGHALARPMYSSSNTSPYASRGFGAGLDNLDGLYSTVFNEVLSFEPQAHSWLRLSAEAKQISSLACRTGVPPMCLFYPHNKDENLFCWGMTKAWGQQYWGTKWHMSLKEETEMLSPTFNFESSHPLLYERPQPVSEVGILFSAHTVWFHKDKDKEPDYIVMSDPASVDCYVGWCETLLTANIPFDVMGEKDLEEKKYFDRFRLIIVPNAVCLSDKAIGSLREFARNGGNIIVTHQSGMKDESGCWREKYPLSKITGADYKNTRDNSKPWVATKSTKIKMNRCNLRDATVVNFKPHENTEIWMRQKDNKSPVLMHNKYGKGAVIAFAGKPGVIVCVNRHRRSVKNDKRLVKIDFDRNNDITDLMVNSVRHLLQPDFQLETKGVPKGFVVSMFGHGTRTVLHIMNAAGTLSDSGKTIPVSSVLKFPPADSLPGGAKMMLLKVKRKGTRAVLSSPEFSGEQELICHRNDKYAVIEVPSDLVRCYSVIELY